MAVTKGRNRVPGTLALFRAVMKQKEGKDREEHRAARAYLKEDPGGFMKQLALMESQFSKELERRSGKAQRTSVPDAPSSSSEEADEGYERAMGLLTEYLERVGKGAGNGESVLPGS